MCARIYVRIATGLDGEAVRHNAQSFVEGRRGDIEGYGTQACEELDGKLWLIKGELIKF